MRTYQAWLENLQELSAPDAPPHEVSDLRELIRGAVNYWAMDDNRWAWNLTWEKLATFQSPHWSDDLLALLFQGDGPPQSSSQGSSLGAAFLDHPQAGLATLLTAGFGATSWFRDRYESEAATKGARYRSALGAATDLRARVALLVAHGHQGSPNDRLVESRNRYDANLRLILDPACGGGEARQETFLRLQADSSISTEELVAAVRSLCPTPGGATSVEQKQVDFLEWVSVQPRRR